MFILLSTEKYESKLKICFSSNYDAIRI